MFELPVDFSEAFKAFQSSDTGFALPVRLCSSNFVPERAILHSTEPESSFQKGLSLLESVVDTRTPIYLVIRYRGSLVFITYVPYLASDDVKSLYTSNSLPLASLLGEDNFSTSIICKEPGDITDSRAWEERDKRQNQQQEDCADGVGPMKDLGHMKTICRMCDRRMKNPITNEALEALKQLNNAGSCAQLCVEMSSLTLRLNFHEAHLTPTEVITKIPKETPSFTFYRHPDLKRLYFIYFSPDNAPVKARMAHTTAIPGLSNVIAKEQGLTIDQKIEIHELEDLVFENKDNRIGKFRSMYLLNERNGTESLWKDMERAG